MVRALPSERHFLVDTLARRAVQSAGTRARLLFVKRIYGLNFLPCGGCATVLAPLLGYHVTPAPMAFCGVLVGGAAGVEGIGERSEERRVGKEGRAGWEVVA